MNLSSTITVSVEINAPLHKVWDAFTQPDHITQWYFASPDWHAPYANHDVRVGGSFVTRMESKDGANGFDFEGTFTLINPMQQLDYVLSDGRSVSVLFQLEKSMVRLIQTFQMEQLHSRELQQEGWQSILNQLKRYIENQSQ